MTYRNRDNVFFLDSIHKLVLPPKVRHSFFPQEEQSHLLSEEGSSSTEKSEYSHISLLYEKCSTYGVVLENQEIPDFEEIMSFPEILDMCDFQKIISKQDNHSVRQSMYTKLCNNDAGKRYNEFMIDQKRTLLENTDEGLLNDQDSDSEDDNPLIDNFEERILAGIQQYINGGELSDEIKQLAPADVFDFVNSKIKEQDRVKFHMRFSLETIVAVSSALYTFTSVIQDKYCLETSRLFHQFCIENHLTADVVHSKLKELIQGLFSKFDNDRENGPALGDNFDNDRKDVPVLGGNWKSMLSDGIGDIFSILRQRRMIHQHSFIKKIGDAIGDFIGTLLGLCRRMFLSQSVREEIAQFVRQQKGLAECSILTETLVYYGYLPYSALTYSLRNLLLSDLKGLKKLAEILTVLEVKDNMSIAIIKEHHFDFLFVLLHFAGYKKDLVRDLMPFLKLVDGRSPVYQALIEHLVNSACWVKLPRDLVSLKHASYMKYIERNNHDPGCCVGFLSPEEYENIPTSRESKLREDIEDAMLFGNENLVLSLLEKYSGDYYMKESDVTRFYCLLQGKILEGAHRMDADSDYHFFAALTHEQRKILLNKDAFYQYFHCKDNMHAYLAEAFRESKTKLNEVAYLLQSVGYDEKAYEELKFFILKPEQVTVEDSTPIAKVLLKLIKVLPLDADFYLDTSKFSKRDESLLKREIQSKSEKSEKKIPPGFWSSFMHIAQGFIRIPKLGPFKAGLSFFIPKASTIMPPREKGYVRERDKFSPQGSNFPSGRSDSSSPW